MKFLSIFIAFISLFAFNPIKTTIITTTHTTATIDKDIKPGMTGYVIHNNMMIAKAISMGHNTIKYLPLKKLKNPALATPDVMPKTDDTVIFGLYNKRALIVAPNQNIYINTQKSYPQTTFISSDVFATYFETKPTKQDFQKFCNDFNVGLIYFILDKQYTVDCNTFVVLNEKNTTTAKYKRAMFVNYSKLENSMFSSKPKNWIEYYKSMLKKVKGY